MSASHDGNNAGQTTSPIMCANNCGFFGNPLTGNMCSKCARERKSKEETKSTCLGGRASCSVAHTWIESDAAKVAAAVAVPAPVVDAMDTTSSSPVPSPSIPLAAPAPTPAAAAAATAMDASPTGPSELATKAETQADATKCWSCQRKVGLLGFKCKCTYVFCSKHRYADQHTCSFDYKTAAKEQIKKANPVVEGAKIVKI